jgi:hypothetical protein
MRDYLSLIKNYIYYYLWILVGRPSPPANILYKRKRILKLAKIYNCDTFIETGTADGKTIKFLRNYFKKLLSVEIYKQCFDISSNRVGKYKNVKLFFGDSRILLILMTEQIEGRALFWLDGHYSGQGTGKGDTNCPVYEELGIIKNLERTDHIILIDDAREFNGQNDYPTLNSIIAKLKEINPKYNIRIEFDCIISIPENLDNEFNK